MQGSLEVDLKAEEADNTAAAAPVDRLILAVHGIGQKLSGASIVDDATALRSLVPTCTYLYPPVLTWYRPVPYHIRGISAKVSSHYLC